MKDGEVNMKGYMEIFRILMVLVIATSCSRQNSSGPKGATSVNSPVVNPTAACSSPPKGNGGGYSFFCNIIVQKDTPTRFLKAGVVEENVPDIQILSAPAHGTASHLDNLYLSYQPTTDYSGLDVFKYSFKAQNGNTTTVEWSIDIGSSVSTTLDDVKVKYVYIIDQSGSNSPGIVTGTLQPTDPDGSRRYSPILNFLNQQPVHPNVYNAAIKFNKMAETFQPFTNVRDEFKTAINQEYALLTDEANTNVIDAIGLAGTLVLNDIRSEKVTQAAVSKKIRSIYSIFLISDGVPNCSNCTMPNILSQVKMVTDIQSLETEYVERITINTLYYYSSNVIPEAEDVMKQISGVGGGRALTFPGTLVLTMFHY